MPRPPGEPGVMAKANAVTMYAAARRNEIGVAHPTAGEKVCDDSHQASARIGTAQSISAGRETGWACRYRRTPRSRKKTWARRARTRARSAGWLGATKGASISPQRTSPMRKNPHEAIQSRKAGRRNLRYKSRNTTNRRTVPAAWTTREKR